jgi:O-antigen ligase
MTKSKTPDYLSLITQGFLILICFLMFLRYGVKFDTGLGYREVILVLAGGTIITAFHLKKSIRKKTNYTENSLLFIAGLIILISFIFSDIKAYGIAGVFGFFAFLNTVFLASRLKNSNLKILFYGLVSLAALVSIYGLVSFSYEPAQRLTSNFINPLNTVQGFPNALALFLLIMWPYAAYKMNNTKGKYIKYLFIFIFGLIIASLYLSYSRGAMIAFAIQIIILALLSYRHFLNNKYKWIIGLVIGMILTTTTLNLRIFNNQETADISQKITFENNENITSVDERLQFFITTAELIRDNPLFGYGPHTFRFVYPTEQKLLFSNSDHPHNIFLKYAYESGVITAILILFAFLILISKSITKSDKHNQRKEYLLTAFLGAIAHSMIDFNFNFLLIFAVFGITAGVLIHIINKDKKEEPPHEIIIFNNAVLIIFFITSVILSATGLTDYKNTDPYSDFDTIKRYNAEEIKTHMNKYSNSLYPREFWLQLSDYYILRSKFQKALTRINKHINVNPYDKYGYLNKGRILFKTGEYNDALKYFKEAVNKDPKNSLSVHYHYLKTINQIKRFPDDNYLNKTLYPILDDFMFYAKNNLHYVAMKNEIEFAACTMKILEKMNDTSRNWEMLINDLESYAEKYRNESFELNICP